VNAYGACHPRYAKKARSVSVWEKAFKSGKRDVRDDTPEGKLDQDELETTDEQTPESDRKGGILQSAQTKRRSESFRADEGMGRVIFHVYR
jgi:hypothetical protein